jgi:hypothetical protein
MMKIVMIGMPIVVTMSKIFLMNSARVPIFSGLSNPPILEGLVTISSAKDELTKEKEEKITANDRPEAFLLTDSMNFIF